MCHLGLQSKPRPSLNPYYLHCPSFCDLLSRACIELLCNLGCLGSKQLSLNLNPCHKKPTLSVYVPPILFWGITEQQPPVEHTCCLTHMFLCWQGPFSTLYQSSTAEATVPFLGPYWGRGRGDRCHTDCVPRSSNSKGQTRAGGGDEGGEGGGSLRRGQWRRRGCSGGSEGSLDMQGRAGPERGGCRGTRAVGGAFPTLGAATAQSLALFTPPPPRPPCACSLAPAPAQPAPQGLSRSLSCSALGGHLKRP